MPKSQETLDLEFLQPLAGYAGRLKAIPIVPAALPMCDSCIERIEAMFVRGLPYGLSSLPSGQHLLVFGLPLGRVAIDDYCVGCLGASVHFREDLDDAIDLDALEASHG